MDEGERREKLGRNSRGFFIVNMRSRLFETLFVSAALFVGIGNRNYSSETSVTPLPAPISISAPNSSFYLEALAFRAKCAKALGQIIGTSNASEAELCCLPTFPGNSQALMDALAPSLNAGKPVELLLAEGGRFGVRPGENTSDPCGAAQEVLTTLNLSAYYMFQEFSARCSATLGHPSIVLQGEESFLVC